MIYHHEKGYLFVHIQKNGGTSITEALVKHAGATFISPLHLQLKSLEFSGQRPFVFAVVRNPWDRLVSWYEMMNRKGVHNNFSKYLLEPSSNGTAVSFSDFIRRTAVITELNVPEISYSKVDAFTANVSMGYLKSLSFNQLDYLTDHNGEESFDAIIRFEYLVSDFCKVLTPFHKNITADWLMKRNANPLNINYRDYFLNSDDRMWVATLYERDINRFKFVF
jgi:hypothetical protein